MIGLGDDVEWLTPFGLVIKPRRGPLHPTYLPLDDAVTVLYGLNGAGKSFVLDAMRAAFTGLVPDRLRDTEIYLLAQVPDPQGDWPVGLVRAFEGVTRNQLSPHALHERLQEQIHLAWQESWSSGFFDEFAFREELEFEVSTHGLLLVRPQGLEVPSWELRPAVIPDEQHPGSYAFQGLLASTEDEDVVNMAPVQDLWLDWPDRVQPAQAPAVLYSETYVFTVSLSGESRMRLWDPVIAEPAEHEVDRETAGAIQEVLDRQDQENFFRALAEHHGLKQGRESARDLTLDEVVLEVQHQANELYAVLLRDAPSLELEVRPQSQWLTNKPLQWVARRTASDQPVQLAWLSHAERRWAELAIRIAIAQSATPVVVLDEPESALHRTAESHMARAIEALASDGVVRFVASTHSPELLDSRGVHRYLVRRRTHDQAGGLVPFTGAALEAMDELGMNPSDLLRRTRGFMLVEGEHDLAALKGWFAAEFAERGIEVLPLRGGSKLRTVLDSRFLFDYTEALLFPFLDDVDLERVQRAWARATKASKTQKTSEVIDGLNRELQDVDSKGAEYFGPFLTRALQLGREGRVVPLGVKRTDILDYLPVTHFVASADSWDNLRSELKRDKRGVPATETEFKKWLKARYRADLSPEAVHSAAVASTPPDEIVQLIEKMASAVGAR